MIITESSKTKVNNLQERWGVRRRESRPHYQNDMDGKDFESIDAAYEAGVQAGINLMLERRRAETERIIANCTRIPAKTQSIIPVDVEAANVEVRKNG